MKTTRNQLKITALFFVLILSTNAYAQKEAKKQNVYVRVYNMEGRIINKGDITFLNDSLIGLKNYKGDGISVRDIGFIKTKRPAGNNIIIGAATGAVVGAAILASSSDPNDWVFSYTKGEGALIGGFSGGFIGGAIGGITAITKDDNTYMINGDLEKWQDFKAQFEVKF